jgi:alginate O-acetyltransferase complex protein AlgI
VIVGTFAFIVFLIVVLVVYHAVPWRTVKYGWLTLASWGFYAAASPGYLWVLLLLTVIDYVAARKIAACDVPAIRKRWLLLSIVANLSLLAAFKYTVFATDNALSLLKWLGWLNNERTWDLLLPLGISFHTFQGISYTVDVYRNKIAPVRSLLDYCLFVAFFPQLAAGPIVRAVEFLPQLVTPPRVTSAQMADGLRLFAFGLFKKLVIADQLHVLLVDPVFSHPELYDSAALRLAAVAWAVQIYCDFSGYSDLAVGTAKWFGFELPANFHLPYLATSISDFWRRWHVSLSSWLRDYLYFPLGGSKHGEWRTARNLIILFVLCGLWHGAAWHWLAYGLFNGILMVGHRQWDRLVGPHSWRRSPLWISFAWLLTVFQLIVGLVLIRMESWTGGWRILSALVGWNNMGDALPISFLIALLLGIGLLGHAVGLIEKLKDRIPPRLADWTTGVAAASAMIGVVVLSPAAVKSFIYIAF